MELPACFDRFFAVKPRQEFQMLYHVSRNGQMYGPYTLEDLRRYVASGHVLPTDLAKNDEMPEWLPVHQVLGSVGVGGFGTSPVAYPQAAYGYAPYGQASDYPQAALAYPDPPNLPWVLELVLGFFTCGLFTVVWNIVIAAWLRRVQPNSQALMYYIIATVVVLLNSGTSFSVFYAMHHHYGPHIHPVTSLIGLAGWVLRLIARFTMRSSLEEHFNGPEPIGLRLSGVMTFFFGGIYFQYHLNRINEIKNAIRYRGAAR